MFFVELTIRYASNKFASMSPLDPKVFARRLRRDLDFLKLPHPPEANLEILPRECCKFFWETRSNSLLHSLVKQFVLNQDKTECSDLKRLCKVESISMRTGFNHKKPSELNRTESSRSRRSPTRRMSRNNSYDTDSHPRPRPRSRSPLAPRSPRRYRSLSTDVHEERSRDSRYRDRQPTPAKPADSMRCSFNSSEDLNSRQAAFFQPKKHGLERLSARRSIEDIESLQASLMAIEKTLEGSVTATPAPSRPTPEQRLLPLPLSSPSHLSLSVRLPPLPSLPIVPRPPSASPPPLPSSPQLPPVVLAPSSHIHPASTSYDTPTHIVSEPSGLEACPKVQHTQEEKETISKLTRQLWDTRRNLMALSARGLVIEDRLREIKAQEDRNSNDTGESTRACEDLDIGKKVGYWELQDKMKVLEGLLCEEIRSRVKAEVLLGDVLRECEKPTIVPQMYEMFMLGSE
ncbi:hypothetical protein E1B28_007657 [Marasmius oreades]|uniref:Uncharacterized protein n=1 Tax=Marasmius oreades TaxID=181124 RepID=A0A9P7UV67_9AGAR|nr:uncharacterized protein E1B28_007657 [Marasmius oreades]KAG7094036.1 hypothetical protein E1B28_007657 [Marasmius oreades]